MSRPVIESTRIVVRSPEGGRMEVQGKGDAAEVIATAFVCFTPERRAALIAKMQATHERMLQRAAEIARSAA